MDNVVADTNVVIWYFTDPTKLSKSAEKHLDTAASSGAIYVSSITLVELVYLVEKGKLPQQILVLLRDALDDDAAAFRLIELTREIADEIENIPRSVVPDMPDRIIAATALFLNLPLISSDADIAKLTSINTVW
jgi:PIN domain nuclease of toxin-antitoxin system